jgi:hypothetical protein
MPCYTVQLMTVEFRAESRELLLKALQRLNLRYVESETGIRIPDGNIFIDLKNKKVTMDQRASGIVNGIKRSYSELAIEKMCAVKKWFIANRQGNKLEIRRY